MERNSFTFKKAWRDILVGQPEKVREEVCVAIMEYGITGEAPQLKSKAETLFSVIKAWMDEDMAGKEKRESLSQTRRQAAMRRWEKQDEGLHDAKEILHDAKPMQNENLHDANKILHDAKPMQNSSPRARVIVDNQDKGEEVNIKDNNQEKEKESQKKETENVDPEAFIAFFNQEMQRAGALIPHRCAITDRRRSAIMARTREYGRGALAEVVHKAARSDFLNGGGSKAFTASIDWLLRPNNFPKVLEGNYDNPQKTTDNGKDNDNGAGSGRLARQTAELAEELRARYGEI